MAASGSRLGKIFIGIVLGLLIGGAGMVAFYRYVYVGAESALKSAETAYARGVQAMEAKDAGAAMQAFDEARLRTEKAEEAASRKRLKLDSGSEEAKQNDALAAKIFWLRARAVRDHAYARAMSEQKPLPELPDLSTGETYRNFLAVQDPEGRRDMRSWLLQAAAYDPTNAEVLKNALRTELTASTQVPWDSVEPLARNIIKLNPKDTRAQYLLARYDFEQPQQKKDGHFEPTAPEKRVTSRVLQAREHLALSKESGNYPLWRTLYLDAALHQWFANHAATIKKDSERDREEQALRVLLFDGKTGALARARDGEDMERMSAWDAEGLLALHQMALDVALQDRKKPGASDPSRAAEMMTALLNVCEKISTDPARIGDAANCAVAAAIKVEPMWNERPAAEARQQLASVTAIVSKAKEKKISRPKLYLGLANLLLSEAQLLQKQGDRDWERMDKEGIQWLEAGIQLGQESKLDDAALSDLYALSAEMKVVRGAKREAVANELDALRRAAVADKRRAPAVVSLIEGRLAAREGRMEMAREQLEKVVTSGNGDLAFRAYTPLALSYLNLNQPDKAIVVLENADRAYGSFETLSPQERAWVLEFVQSPAQILGLLATAHLEAAKAKVIKQMQAQPGGPIDYELIRGHEEAVDRILQKVRAPEPVNLFIRQMIVGYLASTNRIDRALEAVAELQKDYPDSLDTLKLAAGLRIQKALSAKPATTDRPPPLDDKTRMEMDQTIQQFIAKYPNDRTAKLFWAEWLIHSQRAAEAVAYLKNPKNFPADQDELFSRILAVALMVKGDRDEAHKVLQFLPENPLNDLLLIQFAVTHEEQSKKLGQAISRYQNNGLFRCWNARQDYNAGKYSEAAEAFFLALDITRVKSMAEEGLLKSLVALTQKDTAKARDLTVQMLKSRPDDAALLLALAYTHLAMNEIGRPTDAYERSKTMAAALNLWEGAYLKSALGDRINAPLTKTQFWVLANHPEEARNEILRALQMNDKDPNALALFASIDIDMQSPELWEEARKTLAKLKSVQPDAPTLGFLTSTLDEKEGKVAQAIAGLEEMLRHDPRQSPLWQRWVGLEEHRGNSSQARAVCQRWREHLPDDVTAAETEVRFLAKDGKLPEARSAADAFFARALQRAEQQKAEKPPGGVDLRAWNIEQGVRFDHAVVQVQLSMARAFASAHAWDEAQGWIKRVADKHPDLEAALLLQADTFLSRKMWTQARDAYTEVIKRTPGHYVAGNNLAWILATQFKDLPKAYEVAQQVRRGQHGQHPAPGERLDPAFLDTLGLIYRSWNKPELYSEMRDLFEAARRRYPMDPRMSLYLGDAFAGLHQPEKAEALFAEAVTLAGPDVKNGFSPEQKKEVLQKVEESRKKLKMQTSLP
jgi:predicted Zn-dependent protease